MSGYLFNQEEIAPAPPAESKRKPPATVGECRAGDVVELDHGGARFRVVILTERGKLGDRFVRPITPDGKNLAEPFTADGREPVTFIAEHYRW